MNFALLQGSEECDSSTASLSSRLINECSLQMKGSVYPSHEGLLRLKGPFFKDGHRLLDRRVSLALYLTILMTKSREGATHHLGMGFFVPSMWSFPVLSHPSRVFMSGGLFRMAFVNPNKKAPTESRGRRFHSQGRWFLF